MLAARRRQSRVRLKSSLRFGAHACRLVAAAVLALLAFALFLLADASGAVPPLFSPLHAVAVHSQPGATATSTPIPTSTATPTNTVAATPPSISVVSPASGTGPVGAHVTITGSNFIGASTRLFGSLRPDCTVSSGTLTTVTASGGKISTTFIWPASFGVGTYYICAAGMTSSSASYQVLSSLPPILSLSTLSVEIGQPLIIQGSNFVGLAAGATVSLTESSSEAGEVGTPQTLPVNGVVDSNGGFSVTWTVQAPRSGTATIRAYAGVAGSSPASLQASASVTIEPAATATATVAASPTAVATAIGKSTVTSPPSSGNSANPIGLIILLVAGILISLLVIFGLAVYLARRHIPGGGQSHRPGYTGYGEPTIPQSPYNNGPAGIYSAPGQIFSEWEDPDSEPGPDWHPRPMSGYYPEYDATQSSPYSGQYGADYRHSSWQQAPQDPWRDPLTGNGTYPGENEEWRAKGVPPHPNDDQWPDLGGDSWG